MYGVEFSPDAISYSVAIGRQVDNLTFVI